MSIRIFNHVYYVKYAAPIAFPVSSITIGGGGIANGEGA
jgi:hypothetical protein